MRMRKSYIRRTAPMRVLHRLTISRALGISLLSYEQIPAIAIFGVRNSKYNTRMELYHLLNRGVEKRDIFMEDHDYLRFVHDMWEFNDIDPTSHAIHTFKHLELRTPNFPQKMRTAIVDVHAWCLMKNHYHLLVSETAEGGITKFLRKLNIGYAMYFNEKYKRQGALFQGRTKKIHINSDAYFMHILNYIHFNPLDYFTGAQNWRSRNLENPKRAHEYLMKYRWSSYPDYCGVRNFPSLITTSLFGESLVKFKNRIYDYSGASYEDLPPQLRLE